MGNYDDFDLDLKVLGNENEGETGAKSISLTTVIVKTVLKCTDGDECAMPTEDRPAASCHKTAVAGTIQARC